MRNKRHFQGNIILIIIIITLTIIFGVVFLSSNKDDNKLSLTQLDDDRVILDKDEVSQKNADVDTSSKTKDDDLPSVRPADVSKNSNVSSNTNTPVTIPNIPDEDNEIITTTKIKIVNKCGTNSLQALDEFYQDSEYIYYFKSMQSNCIYVQINGSEYTVKFALNSHLVTIKELENAGFKCLKKPLHLATK